MSSPEARHARNCAFQKLTINQVENERGHDTPPLSSRPLISRRLFHDVFVAQGKWFRRGSARLASRGGGGRICCAMRAVVTTSKWTMGVRPWGIVGRCRLPRAAHPERSRCGQRWGRFCQRRCSAGRDRPAPRRAGSAHHRRGLCAEPPAWFSEAVPTSRTQTGLKIATRGRRAQVGVPNLCPTSEPIDAPEFDFGADKVWNKNDLWICPAIFIHNRAAVGNPCRIRSAWRN